MNSNNKKSGIQTWPHTPRFFLEKLAKEVKRGPTQEQEQAQKAKTGKGFNGSFANVKPPASPVEPQLEDSSDVRS